MGPLKEGGWFVRVDTNVALSGPGSGRHADRQLRSEALLAAG
jgi:hypothetical protein